MITKQANRRLLDGRPIRLLKDKNGKMMFSQKQMFRLHRFLSQSESIMRDKDHDLSLQSDSYRNIVVNEGAWMWVWRTGDYVFYRKELICEYPRLGRRLLRFKKFGKRIIYCEDGEAHTFEVPDVKHPNDKNKSLRKGTGMGVIPLAKLQYDSGNKVVSVTSDFNEETDVRVIDIMRPNRLDPFGGDLVDEDGNLIRARPYNDRDNPDLRYITFCDFYLCTYNSPLAKKTTGYHGSLCRSITKNDSCKKTLMAGEPWRMECSVAVVSN